VYTDKSFSSLRDCVQHLVGRFPQQDVLTRGTEIVTHETNLRAAPRFLFRGEKRCYPDTRSAVDRVRTEGKLPVEELERIGRQIKDETATSLDIHDHAAHAFLQHYGLPTEWIDFTSALDVAAAFASDGEVGSDGLIAVLDREVAQTNANITQFTNLRWAKRAISQKAYAFHALKACDLEFSDSCAEFGLRWFRFRLTDGDKTMLTSALEKLLDDHEDPMAGWLRHQVNRYVAQTGKLKGNIAKWISEMLPMVPLVGRLIGATDEVEFLDPGLVSFDPREEQERSYRYWSEAFPRKVVPSSSNWPRGDTNRCPGT
jgi:hypothetical protein